VSLVGSTDSHLLLALKPSAVVRGSGGDRLTPIRFPARHHGPDNPGHLVGQSDRGELARLVRTLGTGLLMIRAEFGRSAQENGQRSLFRAAGIIRNRLEARARRPRPGRIEAGWHAAGDDEDVAGERMD
jgi:hypothetical protein